MSVNNIRYNHNLEPVVIPVKVWIEILWCDRFHKNSSPSTVIRDIKSKRMSKEMYHAWGDQKLMQHLLGKSEGRTHIGILGQMKKKVGLLPFQGFQLCAPD